MVESKLIEAVKLSDLDTIEDLLKYGVDIEQKDDYGWTALNWAAGKGNTSIIQKLISAGADITNVGRDKRTAYQIALAAAHVESASVLQQAELQITIDLNRTVLPYCRAYLIAELRQYSDWLEPNWELAEDAIVFLHQDYSVTLSMFHGQDVIFKNSSNAWEKFCKKQLAFSVPTDLELAALLAPVRAADIQQTAL